MIRPSGVIERPVVKLDGALLSAELLDDLIDVRVETTVSRPAQVALRFYDHEFDVLDDTKMAIGRAIEVSFLATGERAAVTLFVGEVTSLGVESGPDDVPITVITGQDLSHRLGRNSRQRVFANQTYSDMVRTIASENGLRCEMAATTIHFEHMTQYVDDGAFIDEICRRCGLIWQVNDKTLRVKEATLGTAVATLDRGNTLRRFRAQFDSAELADEVQVRSWDPKSKREIVAVSSTSQPSLSSASLVTDSRRAASSSFRAVKHTGANVTTSPDEATLMAKSLQVRSMGDELRVRGEADGHPSVVAGVTVEITRVGSKLSGNYFVTAAEHIYSTRDYVTRFSCGGGHPSKLADLVGAGQRPSSQRVGALIGVVTNVGKEEFSGMVKVKLPTVGADLESAWARVVTPGGGSGRGLQLMPSINDEVLVVFENGDMSRPFVLGGLWNPLDKLPFPGYITGSDVTEWTLADRGGHAFSFRSGTGDDKRNVELKLADGKTKLFVGQDKIELWAADGKPLQLKSGQGSITITGNGEIEIKGAKITIVGTQEVTGKAPKIELSADATMKLQGQAGLELKSAATAKLDGGGMTEIKGGIVKVN